MHSGHQLMRRVARYIRPCSYRRTNASVTARDRSGSIVNFDRDQSALAPRMRCCRRMRSPVSRRHCHTRATNASRPMSRRLVPSRASMRSTTSCVAMPAWSVPGCQSVLKPRMRCQRTSASSSVQRCAWPMCSDPVTLGGGIGHDVDGPRVRRRVGRGEDAVLLPERVPARLDLRGVVGLIEGG